MILVGIDVASQKHDITIMSSHGEIFNKHFTIENSMDGFNLLLKNIEAAKKHFNDYEVRIGLESTGHYSRNILYFLTNKGFKVMFINPLLTNMDRKALSVRKTKTDKIDAEAICIFLSRNKNNFKPYTISSYHIDELKVLVRSRKSLTKQLNVFTNQLHAYLHQAFPEYYKVFSDITLKGSLAILSKCASLSEFKHTRKDTLIKILHKQSKGRHGTEQIDKLKTLVRNSIGIDSVALSLSIKQAVSTIQFVKSQISEIDLKIKETIDNSNTTILSIPGIGYLTGAIILSEIGDINRFKTDNQLIAYVGIDPQVYQSGTYNASFKMSKRGSSILRWAIFQSAKIIIQHDKVFIEYYEKKKAEGKHYFNIMAHVSKKLIRVIRSILNNNTLYIQQ